MNSNQSPSKPLKGSVHEEEEYEDKCVICLVNVPDVQMRPCGHSMICRVCMRELMTRSEPCPICRKPLVGFDVGVYSGSLGERGLWPTSVRNIRELARNDGFNEYFQTMFNLNIEPFLRWKEVFDVLEIVWGSGCHCTLRESNEQQVLSITRSKDLVKLKTLAKLCSIEFFNDPSLSVAVWRRILEVLELAIPPVEKKVRGKKKNDPRKLEILDAFYELAKACCCVGDFDDGERYFKRANDGYEEQLGRDSEKTLEAMHGLICASKKSINGKIEKKKSLLKRMERVLGEENVLTLKTLSDLGDNLRLNEEYEEAKEVWEKCLAGRMNVLGGNHKDTLDTLNNLGIVYDDMKDYEKALEYYERALKGCERLLGKNHPDSLDSVMNIAIVYKVQKDYGKAEELYQRALEGYEAQFGKDHEDTKMCAENYRNCLNESGNCAAMVELKKAHPNVDNYDV